jgi:hypothetical protein
MFKLYYGHTNFCARNSCGIGALGHIAYLHNDKSIVFGNNFKFEEEFRNFKNSFKSEFIFYERNSGFEYYKVIKYYNDSHQNYSRNRMR